MSLAEIAAKLMSDVVRGETEISHERMVEFIELSEIAVGRTMGKAAKRSR